MRERERARVCVGVRVYLCGLTVGDEVVMSACSPYRLLLPPERVSNRRDASPPFCLQSGGNGRGTGWGSSGGGGGRGRGRHGSHDPLK